MKQQFKQDIKLVIAASISLVVTTAIAHDAAKSATSPVFQEANIMISNAMNEPFASANGSGELIEQNIVTGERSLTITNPFTEGNSGTDVCPADLECPGPWKPTGTFSGGMNGHAFITSAAQQALTEVRRDGTPIRTLSYRGTMGNPVGIAGRGTVPRPLGTQIMPNGNLVQAICDANFFNAGNSDVADEGGLEANQYFPPVSNTPARAANSRILVIDQETMQVIDEYSQPPIAISDQNGQRLSYELWGCFAGIMFDADYMYLSAFHGGAILKIDWRAGIDNFSRGVGSNTPRSPEFPFELNNGANRAKVVDVIDFIGGSAENPHRRDSLRAISFDESSNIYATNRRRSRECLRGEIGVGGCNPGVFRHRVSIDLLEVDGDVNDEDATLALDPGINIIAGLRISRMSARGCDYILEVEGGTIEECNVETLYIGASAMNPGCNNTGTVGANECFTPGGYVAEYRIDRAHLDGGEAWGGGACSGDIAEDADNTGCAQPIATFGGEVNGDVNIDPRMLMSTQRAFIQ